MSARVNGIDRVAVAVGIRLLVQVGVAGDEAPDLRVVRPAPHQRQSRVALRPVAARGPELVGARAAPAARHRLPEGRSRQRPLDGPAAVGDGPLGTQPVVQRRLPVFADQGGPVGVRRRRATLFLARSYSALRCRPGLLRLV